MRHRGERVRARRTARAVALCAALGTGGALSAADSAAAGPTPSSTVAARSGPAALPPFRTSAQTVSAAELGRTWHAGCPVGPAALRLLRLDYVGFDGMAHTGEMVVATSVAPEVERVFRTLYAARFPLRTMEPESAFGGSDPASMALDNTSGFNCRLAVTTGAAQWSVHAYGEAIDVNPVENPYLFEDKADPPNATAYLDRSDVRPGMAVPGGVLVTAFGAVGWFWGGRWTGSPDYQHFSATGG